MKITISIIAIILSLPIVNAQVTIGSEDPPHPSAVLELKSSDKGFLGPRVNLKSTRDTETVPNQTDGLLVLNMHDSANDVPIEEKVKSGKYYYWSENKWVELVVTKTLTENIEQTLSFKGIPRPAIFTLNGTQHIFNHDPVREPNQPERTYVNMLGIINPLEGVAKNNFTYLPLAERVNYTAGTVRLGSVDIGGGKKKYTITFQPGIYSIIFTYEFVPADTAKEGDVVYSPGSDYCWSAVYFMQFPINIKNSDGTISTGLTRVESNCYHGPGKWINREGRYCDHGNTISHVAVLFKETVWDFAFGTGNGDAACNGKAGLSMPNRSTFLYISRMGDAH